MGFFLRAVVTGFGLTLGAALFKKHVAKRIGLEDDDKAATKKTDDTIAQEGASDPELQT